MRYHIETRLAIAQLIWISVALAIAAVMSYLMYPLWTKGIVFGGLSIAIAIGIVLPIYVLVPQNIQLAPLVQLVATIIKLVVAALVAFGTTSMLTLPTNAVAIGLTIGIITAIVAVIVTVYTAPRFPGSTIIEHDQTLQ